MSTSRFWNLGLLIGLLVIIATAAYSEGEAMNRTQAWKFVNEAIDQGLPKTAVERLQGIIDESIADKAYAEATKATAMKMMQQSSLQNDGITQRIGSMRAAIASSPAEMRPVMHAILANWYWNYFQQNRWRFSDRTQTAGEPPADVDTWNLRQILAAIDAQFRDALASSAELQSIPVAQYEALLQQGTAPDSYRPTLFDVIAHNAIDFYDADEHAAAKFVDAFESSAGGPVLGDREEFLAWQPQTTDTDSMLLRGVILLQQVMKFHRQDQNPAALLDADLRRLAFADHHATGDDKTARYQAAMREFAKSHADHETSTRAMHQLAISLQSEDNLSEAHRIATEATKRFPGSVGANLCFNLIQQIETPSATVAVDRVWADPWPTMVISYRNTTKVHLRLVRFDYGSFVKSRQWNIDQLDAEQRAVMLRQPAAKQWSVDLPPTEDFKLRTAEFIVPSDVPCGSYYLIVCDDDKFLDENNRLSFSEVWVSNLSVVVRNDGASGRLEGFVLDSKSGSPISGATIQGWELVNNRDVTGVPIAKTDAEGRFSLTPKPYAQLRLLASYRDDRLSGGDGIWWSPVDPRTVATMSTRIFTDRSIYRPGQPIQFKGICYRIDTANNDYKILANESVEVVFKDANGEEIQRTKHRTNAWGSFSGVVTAPRDRLTGNMSLVVEGNASGSTSFSVEQYKRPKFEVAIESPPADASLGKEITIRGVANGYTGVATSDANVSWRVVRSVRYPDWWGYFRWWMPINDDADAEIASGETTTDARGAFQLTFVAKPDASVSESSSPTFEYRIEAVVTDTTGETRTDEAVISLAYTTLSLAVTPATWATTDEPIELRIRSTTPGGDGKVARGTLKVYALQGPESVVRKRLHAVRPLPGNASADDASPFDPAEPNSWPTGEVVFEQAFETDGAGNVVVTAKLPAGLHRVILEAVDDNAAAVKAIAPLHVIDTAAKQMTVPLPFAVTIKKQSLAPGESLEAVWGSGYGTAVALVEIEHRGNLLQRFWTKTGNTQSVIRQAVDESMRGGFQFRVTMVRENRIYQSVNFVDVPWTNKELSIRWERFVSKLLPGAKETWTAIIQGPDAERTAAEMVATLYDASLDAFRDHNWPNQFSGFYRDRGGREDLFSNFGKSISCPFSRTGVTWRSVEWTYDRLPDALLQTMHANQMFFNRGRVAGGTELNMMMDAASPMPASMSMATADGEEVSKMEADAEGEGTPSKSKDIDLSGVTPRTNLNETAFFFPSLVAGDDGVIRMEFTMPEALTRWRFIGFAHDTQLRAGLLTDTVVTSKDIMVQPNPPRFVREGDEIEFTVKVSNKSATKQTGTVRLTFADARTLDAVDDDLGNRDIDRDFNLSAGESKSFSWRIAIPDDMGYLTYKAVGSTGRLSDGEEGFLPVLSRRVLITESLPLPIRGKTTKAFDFEKLLASGDSKTLRHESLTVQMVSNPSWYAVMALPYLMEFPHECNEQTFNRIYANAIARHIATSDPKIERIFEQWRATPALDSPLTKNEDLKSVMLEETPWVRQADSESQNRRNVGLLFDQNRIDSELRRGLEKLSQSQLDDGGWSWFPGGPENEYITLYIVTGFGRLRHLGVTIDVSDAIESLEKLDDWADAIYQRIKPADRDENHLSATLALYLYGRSFFRDDVPVAEEHRPAFEYWIKQAKRYALKLPSRQSEAHAAIALDRFGHHDAAMAIMASLKERSTTTEDLGMRWEAPEAAWWWYHAPIETQAMMIEAFDEVAKDAESVESCKVWLLNQKQTQDWNSTKATADAVYSLLLRGTDMLASDSLVSVSLGGETIKPADVEAGTGFYEQRLTRGEVQPSLGHVVVKKSDDGIAWGSIHWQYLEDIERVTPHDATPLKLTKQLFVKRNTPQGPTLSEVDSPVAVGDELVVKLILRCDRDMEFIHLKDHRGSGTEPVNVLSSYQYQDGLAYYESTQDTASHFFIDYLPQGTYVFEYSTRVQLRGEYQTGLAAIQCMYAPQYNSHSESIKIHVE